MFHVLSIQEKDFARQIGSSEGFNYYFIVCGIRKTHRLPFFLSFLSLSLLSTIFRQMN